MTDQPEALRLAHALGYLDAGGSCSDSVRLTERSEEIADAAAAELRRLHQENEALRRLLADIRKDEQTLHWHKSIDAEIAAIDATRGKPCA